jgi:hypothetical protein
MNENRREIAFLVRMWLPSGATEQSDWRGSVKAIGSDRQLFVTETRDVAGYIASHLTLVEPRGLADSGREIDPI